MAGLDLNADRSASRQPVWTFPPHWLEDWLDARPGASNPAPRLEHHIRQGRVAWGLLPPDASREPGGFEELSQSMHVARRLADRFGCLLPTAADVNGAPAPPRSLGMALATAGGKSLHLATDPAARRHDEPDLSWWQFPDGRRLLVHRYDPAGTSLLPRADWPWRDWPAILIAPISRPSNDRPGTSKPDRRDAGPTRALEWALRHIDWLDRHFDWPRFRFGRFDDFAAAIIRRHGRALPVLDKERIEASIGLQAGNGLDTARRIEDRLVSAETLATLADWQHGHAPPPAVPQRVERGLARPARHRHRHSRHDDRSGPQAWALVHRAESAATRVFLNGWPLEGPPAGRRRLTATGTRTKNTDRAILLFNTLSWPRGGVVRLNDPRLPAGEFELIDPTTGESVSYERDGRGLEFVAPPVPACGYLCLELRRVGQRFRPGQQAEWQQGTCSLHTSENSLQFHAKGGLARWHDRRYSAQWCSGEAEYPTGAFLYERPGGERIRRFLRQVCVKGTARAILPSVSGWTSGSDGPGWGPRLGGEARIRPRITPTYARIVLEADLPPSPRHGSGAGGYRLVFTLYRGRHELHVRLGIPRRRPAGVAEAGYAVFPIAVEKPYVLVDRISHLVTPADDLAPGSNAGCMAAHHGARIEGDHAGMNLFPLDTPVIAFGAPGAFHFSGNGVFADGTVYATLFQHPPWAIDGSPAAGANEAPAASIESSFDFVLQPTGNDGWDGGLSRYGLEHFRPLLAAVTSTPPAAPARSLLRVEPPAVQLVSLKPAAFEAGYCLRLWNATLDPAEARLTFPEVRRADRLESCDLLERPARPLDLTRDGQARLKLRPHEIATLVMRRA
ncbi:MAG: hypothetical protein HRF43_19650 [Phycisphaerae bacterium]|jgi:hypothetical protein